MKRTNEEMLDLLADILEPAARIIEDRSWARAWQAGSRAQALRLAIKNHKAEIVEILARVDGQEPAEYSIDPVAMFVRLANAFNRPDLEGMSDSLFTSRAQSGGGAPSGPATRDIPAEGR